METFTNLRTRTES